MQNHNSSLRDLSLSLGAAIVLGASSTFGDWIWAKFIPDGAVLPGVVHGALIFLLLALVLGWAAGTRRALQRLVLSLPVAGLAIAAAFYPLARVFGYIGALLATWIAMWLTLALLQRWARERNEVVRRACIRGLVAALASGLAFWAISGIWTDPARHTSYFLRLLYWTFAFLPGFLALLFAQRAAIGVARVERPHS